MKIQLTDLAVQKLKPGVYFDTKTPAFGVRVGKYRRTWIVTKGRDRRVITLGHYPSMSLQEARQSAHATLGAPIQSRTIITFPRAMQGFLAQDRWRPRSRKVLVSSLNHFTWTKALDRITHEDVAATLDAIPGASARAHALKDIRTFFNWCIPRYLDRSPAHGLRADSYKPRQRVLTDDELKRIWNAALQLGHFGTIVHLLILTGARRGEIASLRWENITDEDITFPETKNGREHRIPLSVLAAITLPPRQKGYVFPSTAGEGFYNGWGRHHAQLLKLSGTAGWTLHDLRRTFATNLAALGTPIHVTEKLLNHVSGTTGGLVGIYQRHAYWDEQKSALQAWEKGLQSLVAR